MPATQAHDSIVRTRIDAATKKRAAETLASTGVLRCHQAIADERRLPFEAKTPNAATRQAIDELEAGKGHKFASVAEMMAVLDAVFIPGAGKACGMFETESF